MKHVALSNVESGQRLAKNIYSPQGKVLFFAGETINSETLQELSQLGISKVAIIEEYSPISSTDSMSDTTMDAVNKIIATRFGLYNQHDPIVAAVYAIALERECRTQLSKHSKAPQPISASLPSFQTQKPAPVDLETLLEASNNLGTLPIVFHKLVEVINNPYSSATDAARVIATDPALAAKLLKLVNSVFYGLPAKVDTIHRAVALIGTGQLVMLAMGATLVTAFKGLPISLVNMQSFWSHSLACGVAAKIIAKHANLHNPDSFFIAGLLHDIGRLIFFHQLPSHSFYMITEAKRRQVSMRSLELECLGYTHETLTAQLLHEWHCPDELAERTVHHHGQITPSTPADLAVIPAANFLAQALGYGSSGEPFICYMHPAGWKTLGIEPVHLADFTKKMEEMMRELRALLTTEP